MKKTNALGVLAVLLFLGLSLTSFVSLGDEQDVEKGVNFIVEYNNKIYDGDSDIWNFTVHNGNITDDTEEAWFFFKIYLDDSLLWDEYNDTHHQIWQCNKGTTVTRNYTFPNWNGPAMHKVRIELYWHKDGSHQLMVKHTKVVKTAKVFIINWVPSPQTVPRGKATPSSLSISFANGGNDDMYNASISVIDADELEISPQSQDLGNITAGEKKTINFSVVALETKERARTHNPKFQIVYNDFRSVTHAEEYTTPVDAMANPNIQNLLNIISGVAIATAAGGILALIALAKRAKRAARTSAFKGNSNRA